MFPKLQMEGIAMRLVNGEMKQWSQKNWLQPIKRVDRRRRKARNTGVIQVANCIEMHIFSNNHRKTGKQI